MVSYMHLERRILPLICGLAHAFMIYTAFFGDNGTGALCIVTALQHSRMWHRELSRPWDATLGIVS